MPAVTLSTTAPFYGRPIVNMNGSHRERYYLFTIAADGDYLDVPMRTVAGVNVNDVAITALGIQSVAIQGYGSRITFNSGAGNTGVYCRVTGH